MREGRHSGHGQGGGLRGGEWVHSGHIQQTLFTSSAHNVWPVPPGPSTIPATIMTTLMTLGYMTDLPVLKHSCAFITMGKQNKRLLQM